MKESSLSLDTLSNYSLQTEVGVEIFEARFILENNIEKVKLSSTQQKKLKMLLTILNYIHMLLNIQ